jgi:pseudouridine kinase
MTDIPKILCIGSVLWDVIGRSKSAMRLGSDVPGRITQLPGGVAMNIAMTLRRFDLHPALLSVVGQDAAGTQLISEASGLGLICTHIYRSDDLPTDRYAAIADAHSLEAAGEKILTPLHNGTLGNADAPYAGMIALDGNLTLALLSKIASDPLFAAADLRVAPASPGKAERLRPFLDKSRATIYVNLEEAELLCQSSFETATEAATALVTRGAARALVTDGGKLAAEADASGVRHACPPQVLVARVTGAGDTFMAAHMNAELHGASPQDALEQALQAAARYVSGETAH